MHPPTPMYNVLSQCVDVTADHWLGLQGHYIGHITHSLSNVRPHRYSDIRHKRPFVAAAKYDCDVVILNITCQCQYLRYFVYDRHDCNDPISNNLTCLNILPILLQTHAHWLEAWEYSVLLIWLGDLLQCKKGKTETHQKCNLIN